MLDLNNLTTPHHTLTESDLDRTMIESLPVKMKSSRDLVSQDFVARDLVTLPA